MTIDRNTPLSLPFGKRLRNRIVVPPMASQTVDGQGYVTEKTLNHYQRLAESGAGLIFVEYSYVHSSGKGEPHQLGVSEKGHLVGLKRLADLLHKSGALAGLQIVHVGGKADTRLTGEPLWGASALAVPVKGMNLETPQEITLLQIQELKRWYLEAARRVYQAGFDFVELHMAHGYGLNQWLSPLTNQRLDSYGGSLENRSRLVREIVKEIKSQLPRLLLSVRMPAQDHFAGGLEVQDMQWVAQALQALGADLFDISSGIGGWRRPEGSRGEGYLVSDAELIKQVVEVPVMGVGGIQSGAAIDEFLSQKRLDLAAVGRAILENPQQWRQKNVNERSFA